MQVLTFALRRFGRLLLTVLLISTIIFFVIRVIPGDPALVIAGIDATQEDIQAIRAQLGTDRPLIVQYFGWLSDILRFDFGTSLISSQPVTQLILERFPITLTLAVMGIVLSIIIAVPLGVLSAVKRWSFWDYLGMVFSQMGMAIPSFWLGIMLLLILAVRIKIFPLFGSGSIRHLILPALSLGIARAAARMGIIAQKSSILARATFETPDKQFVNATIKGNKERLTSVIENIILNQPVPIGTGLPGLQVEVIGPLTKKDENKKTAKKEVVEAVNK